MSLPFALPPIAEGGATPLWKQNGFQIGTEFTSVLQYSINHSGWNDELTEFHEESAGDQHFIDLASRQSAVDQLKLHLTQTHPTILEIGCSSGFMLQTLHRNFPEAIIIGSDVVEAPLKKLAQILPHIPLIRFDLLRCPLPDNSVDAIVMLNVLEHIENDDAALQQIYRILKPGGILVIEVPAGPHLYDAYDKILMHFRRYILSDLIKSLKEKGFKIKKQSHLGVLLYPGFWLVKKRNRHFVSTSDAVSRKKVDNAIRKTSQNPLLSLLMRFELWLGKYISYPTGIRCIVTCQKETLSR